MIEPRPAPTRTTAGPRSGPRFGPRSGIHADIHAGPIAHARAARWTPWSQAARAACGAAVLAAVCSGPLTGCGAPARPLELSITDMDSLQLRSWLSPQLRRNVDLLPVQGGQDTNPLWGTRMSDMSLTQAYQESLRRVGLMPDVPDTGRYQLKVELMAVAQPNVPMAPEVAVSVRYTLTERGKAPVYQRILRTTQKAGLDDSLSPTQQLRIATEGALRSNIGELLRDLASLPLPT